MKRKNIKNCKSFKSIHQNDAIFNKEEKNCCSHCIYFSSKNCHLDSANDIEPDIDFL